MYFSNQTLKLKKPLFLSSAHVSSRFLNFLALFISHSLKTTTKEQQIKKSKSLTLTYSKLSFHRLLCCQSILSFAQAPSELVSVYRWFFFLFILMSSTSCMAVLILPFQRSPFRNQLQGNAQLLIFN